MRNIKISILFFFKNNEDYIKYLNKYFSNIELLYKGVFNFEYLILYGASNDKTLKRCELFLKNREGNIWYNDSKYLNIIHFLRSKDIKIISDYVLIFNNYSIPPNTLIKDLINLFKFYILDLKIENKIYQEFKFPVKSNNFLNYSLIDYKNIKDDINLEIIKNKKIIVTKKKFYDNISNNIELLIQRKDNCIDEKLEYSKKGRFIRELNNMKNIGAVSCYDSHYDHVKDDYMKNHYNNTMGFITLNNKDSFSNDNTCLFENCKRCINHRKKKNIKIKEKLLPNDKISKVNALYPNLFMVKTYIFNKIKFHSNIDNNINLYKNLCENIRTYGNIIIKPKIINITTNSNNENFMKISKKIHNFVPK